MRIRWRNGFPSARQWRVLSVQLHSLSYRFQKKARRTAFLAVLRTARRHVSPAARSRTDISEIRIRRLLVPVDRRQFFDAASLREVCAPIARRTVYHRIVGR